MAMETKAGTGSSQLIIDLNTRLAGAEDAETAIAIYRMATWLAGQLDDVRRSACEIAQADMDRRNVKSLRTPVGAAGWTGGDGEQLDEDAWRVARARDPALVKLQQEFESARAALLQAQKPYIKSPAPEFFIR